MRGEEKRRDSPRVQFWVDVEIHKIREMRSPQQHQEDKKYLRLVECITKMSFHGASFPLLIYLSHGHNLAIEYRFNGRILYSVEVAVKQAIFET